MYKATVKDRIRFREARLKDYPSFLVLRKEIKRLKRSGYQIISIVLESRIFQDMLIARSIHDYYGFRPFFTKKIVRKKEVYYIWGIEVISSIYRMGHIAIGFDTNGSNSTTV